MVLVQSLTEAVMAEHRGVGWLLKKMNGLLDACERAILHVVSVMQRIYVFLTHNCILCNCPQFIVRSPAANFVVKLVDCGDGTAM